MKILKMIAVVSFLLVFSIPVHAMYMDPETGISYGGHRDYNNKTGRYIESDPAGLAAGINTYSYAFSNPLKFTDPSGLGVCWYNNQTGQMTCVSTIANGGGSGFSGQFASGNNSMTDCKNNGACETFQNIGPIPSGEYEWNPSAYTSKPNGYVLDPVDNTGTLGPHNDPRFYRTEFRTHSCKNPFGPSKKDPMCSAGCITGTADTVQDLNDFLETEWGAGQNNFLYVINGGPPL